MWDVGCLIYSVSFVRILHYHDIMIDPTFFFFSVPQGYVKCHLPLCWGDGWWKLGIVRPLQSVHCATTATDGFLVLWSLLLSDINVNIIRIEFFTPVHRISKIEGKTASDY